jgi:hypothetical protein
MATKVQKSPAKNRAKKQKGLVMVSGKITQSTDILPIPKLWQQDDAGYQDESGKSNSIESSEDKQEGQDEA